MSTLTSSPATWDDRDVEPTPEELARQKHENWLETESGIEFVDGHIVEKPMSMVACEVEANVVTVLKIAGRRADGWRVYSSGLGYKVYPDDPTKFRKPDVSAIRRARLVEGAQAGGFAVIPADLVAEVVSPNDKANDLNAKVREYLAHGFKLVWVVDPDARSVFVYRAGNT